MTQFSVIALQRINGAVQWEELDRFNTLEAADKYMADTVHCTGVPFQDLRIRKVKEG